MTREKHNAINSIFVCFLKSFRKVYRKPMTSVDCQNLTVKGKDSETGNQEKFINPNLNYSISDPFCSQQYWKLKESIPSKGR